MIITFSLLALSICAVWFPAIRFRQKIHLPLWAPIFSLSVSAGLITGHLRPLALASLGTLILFAYLGTRAHVSRYQRMVFGFLSGVAALLMAMHRLPGFNNPVLWENLKLASDAAPFTLYANFDKGAAGLVLLAFFCKRITGKIELIEVTRKAFPIIIATLICVLTAATSLHYVRPEFKLSAYTGVFLLVNLFFAVIAEETFFRGLIQDRLAKSLAALRFGKVAAVTVSALLFGIAHFAGGTTYVALATLSGVGWAVAYARTERIESTITAHFLLNAIHFIGFTYPFVQ